MLTEWCPSKCVIGKWQIGCWREYSRSKMSVYWTSRVVRSSRMWIKRRGKPSESAATRITNPLVNTTRWVTVGSEIVVNGGGTVISFKFVGHLILCKATAWRDINTMYPVFGCRNGCASRTTETRTESRSVATTTRPWSPTSSRFRETQVMTAQPVQANCLLGKTRVEI